MREGTVGKKIWVKKFLNSKKEMDSSCMLERALGSILVQFR